MNRVVRILTLAMVVALIAAACGREDPQATQTAPSEPPVDAEEQNDNDVEESGPSDSDAEQSSANADEQSDAEPTAEASLAQGAFGDLGEVCGTGDGEPAPIDDVPGIDGTTINVGTMADPGFTGRPGLNQEIFDLATAVAAWCNEQGGVRGYEIDLGLYDTKLTEHPNRVLEACDRDFFLVGSLVVFDDSGQVDRLACALPEIAASQVSPTAFDADLVLNSTPVSLEQLAIGELEYAAQRWPDSVDNIGMMAAGVGSSLDIQDRTREAMSQLGWDPVYVSEYNAAGESNWKPFVQAMDEAGVEIVQFLGDPDSFAALQRAAADIEFEPAAWLPSVNTYDLEYLTVAGDAVANTFFRAPFHPFELADENQATSDYIEMMETYNSGGKIAFLGNQALSAWMLFLTSVGTCIDARTLNRDCVYEAAGEHAEWTGGGLHVRADPTAASLPECYLMIEATVDGFVVPADFEMTDGIFRCSPEAVTTLATSDFEGARCPSGKEGPLPSEC